MNISAILIVVPVAEIDPTVARLETLPGVEVRHRDPATGRLLAIQEAASISAEVEGLKRIQALSGVILAEMVQHYFEEDPEVGRWPEPSEDTVRVPSLLVD